MPNANLESKVVVFDDVENGSNPKRKHVDWSRSVSGLSFEQVYSDRFTLAPGVTRTLESGIGATDLSATAVSMSPASGKSAWYQIRGAFASSPWALALSVGAQSILVTAQVDGSILVTGAGLASLTSVKPGDWIYLGGSSYGDVGNFSAANQGFWIVSSVSSGSGLLLRRAYDEDGSGVTETVSTIGTTDIQHLPDSLRPRWAVIRGGLVFAGLKTVVAAAIGWVAVATESQFLPTAAYTFDRLVVAPKYIAYVRIESDQPVTLSIGDVAAAVNQVSLLPVQDDVEAWYEAFAFASSIAIVNAGGAHTATLNTIYAIK